MTDNHTEMCAADAAIWGQRLEVAFGLEAGDLAGKSRDRYMVPVRALLVHALRARNYSTPVIGRAIGDRNHTSIMRIMESWPLERARQQVMQTARGQRPETLAEVEAILAEAKSAQVPRRMNHEEQRRALPPVTLVAEGRTLRLDSADPDAAAFKAVVDRLRAAKRRDRRGIWSAYCEKAYPLTATHQSLVLPVGIAG